MHLIKKFSCCFFLIFTISCSSGGGNEDSSPTDPKIDTSCLDSLIDVHPAETDKSTDTNGAGPEIKIIGYEEDALILGFKPEKNTVENTDHVAKLIEKITNKDKEIKRIKKVKDTTDADYNLMPEKMKRLYCSYKVKFKEKTKISKIIKEINKEKEDIEYAQVNYKYNPAMNPNDPAYVDNLLWGITATSTNSAWNLSLGDNVIVAVIDTGVDYSHPDIIDNMWNDGQGHYGYDFSDDDNDPMDYAEHGTHVAGIISATDNNSLGLAGVSPNVKIMAVKVFPSAYSDVLAQGITYAAENGADILNNSWGPKFRNPDDPVISSAIDFAHTQNCTIVFAAGNSNDDVQYYFGANHPNAISVASVNSSLDRHSMSNYGALIDVAAPGVNIYSLKPGGGFQYMSGTSMACPYVSGLAALIKSDNPGYTNDEIADIIVSNITELDEPLFYGAGFMDSYRSLINGSPASPPSEPAISSITDAEEGVNINITGSNFNPASSQIIIEGNGVNRYADIFSCTASKIIIKNTYAYGEYQARVCNGISCSPFVPFTITEAPPSESPEVSYIPDVEEDDSIVIYGDLFDTNKLKINVKGEGIDENADILFACETAVKISNMYEPGIYNITVLNNTAPAKMETIEIHESGTMTVPSYNLIEGNDMSDWLTGTSSDDKINGFDSGDYILGREGNDTLCGGSDCDLYVYSHGDGIDTIYDEDGYDMLLLREMVSETVTGVREGNDHVVYVPGGRITIKDYYAGHPVEIIGF